MNPLPPASQIGVSRSSLPRVLFGPLMLVTAGALFIVDYSGGPPVGRTWPVFIIVAGLIKLAEFIGGRG